MPWMECYEKAKIHPDLLTPAFKGYDLSKLAALGKDAVAKAREFSRTSYAPGGADA